MPDIEELRNKIDKVTIKMIHALKERMTISEEIGRIKKEANKNIIDEEREKDLRSKIIKVCNEIGLKESVGTKFLNFLLNESTKIQTETHLSIFLKAKALEEQGKKIIHMEVGEPDFMPPTNTKQSMMDAYDKGFVKYGEAAGMPKFRDALAKKFNIKRDNILVTPGARFSIYLAITTLLNPGDEIIVIEPAWPAYRDCANNVGVKVRAIKTTLEEKWEPSIQKIKDSINDNTKMIVLNYPNNPTGKILSQETQNGILSLAEEKNMYVLSDEIYSEYSKNWESVLEYGYKKAITVQSFSKSHAMTGFRIGYTISDKQIIKKMGKLLALCMTSVSEPIQYAAMNCIEYDTRANSELIKRRLGILVKEAKKMDLEFVEPNGAMYLFARVKKDGFNSIQFTNHLLRYGLALASGEGFGGYGDHIRISACQDEKKLIEGMNILGKVLGENGMKKITIIGAGGKMGRWFAKYFQGKKFEVTGYDSENDLPRSIIESPSLVSGVLQADYVLLCTPTRRTPEIIRLIAKEMKRGTYLIEITSQKSKTISALSKMPPKINAICIHPMFGPGVKNLKNKNIISIPVRDAKKELTVAKNLFSDANFVTIDANEHDKKIAIILGLTHLMNLAFANILSKDEKVNLTDKMSGATFKIQKILSESILTESPELIETIITNPEMGRFAEEFWKDVGRLLSSAQDGNSEEIGKYVRSCQEKLSENTDLEASYKKLTTMVNAIDKK